MARRSTLAIAVAAVVLAAGFVAPAGGATAPIPLLIPQSTAFGVLGHSCGGIQEQVFATGFDATSGYPVGAAYVSTRCGGSGRGGGYHTTTYSAWVSASWDYTGALLSSGVLTTAPTTDPNFSAFDAYGNEIYNVSNAAYLSWAPTFVPAPRVTSISSGAGAASGGTSVTITGTGFTDATVVSFGDIAAGFTVNSDTSITAVSPAAAAGTVDVTVVSAGGTSATSASDEFTFVAAPSLTSLSPEVGAVTGGTDVTITGTGFSDATAVFFGDTAAGFTVNSDTSIDAFAPAVETPDNVAVTVTSIGGTSAHVAGDQFTYVAVPTAPTGVVASTGDGDAVVRWTAPASNGAPLTGYVVTPYVDGAPQTSASFSSTATAQTVTGLTNGTTYTFTVAAANGAATGPESAPSAAITIGVPSPPTSVRARSGSTGTATGPLVVSFVAGANNGAAISQFTARCTSSNGGVAGTRTGTAGPLTITGLTTAERYVCTVTATNARGVGRPSAGSAPVIVGSPAPPTGVAAARVATGQIRVTFTLGGSNGSAITSQVASCVSTNGGVARTATHSGAGAAPITVVGLTAGKTYACTVRAVNARGAGLASAPSSAVNA